MLLLYLPVHYTLTIYTFKGDSSKKIDISYAEQLLKDIKVRNNLKYKLSIVMSDRTTKEHDQGIFTNYLRITSGDTFNFLNSTKGIISKGTEITFCSMANPVEFNAAQEAFVSIRESVANLSIQERAKRVCGEIQKISCCILIIFNELRTLKTLLLRNPG